MRAKTMAAGLSLGLAVAVAGCGTGSSVGGTYEGVMQEPDGDQRDISLELEERNDGTLRAIWGMDGEERELRLVGDAPTGGQFSLNAEPGDSGYETAIDGEVSGVTLEADFYTGSMSAPVTAERSSR